MSTLYDTTTEVTNNTVGCYAFNWYAQTFTASQDYIITSVEIKMYREGNPGTLTVGLRATDAGGEPTGSDLTSGQLDSSTITTDTNGEWVKIVFDNGYTLSQGTVYAIVVRTATGNSSNEIRIRINTSNPYADGAMDFSNDSGSSWTGLQTNDFLLKTYGESPVPSDRVYSKKLVAIGNNSFWYESSLGTMAELSAASGTLSTTKPLTATEAYQKIFIANKTNLKVADFVNVKISTDDAC